MGFRTVVILYNDQHDEWSKDPELGRKISYGMNAASAFEHKNEWNSPARLPYGNVMECSHADTGSMFAIDGYYGRRMATTSMGWSRKSDEVDLELIKKAADKLGYRLVKKS